MYGEKVFGDIIIQLLKSWLLTPLIKLGASLDVRGIKDSHLTGNRSLCFGQLIMIVSKSA